MYHVLLDLAVFTVRTHRAFFAPQYCEDLRAISDKAWEDLHEELMREDE